MAEKNNILKLAYQTKESDIKKYKGKVKSEIKEIEKEKYYIMETNLKLKDLEYQYLIVMKWEMK